MKQLVFMRADTTEEAEIVIVDSPRSDNAELRDELLDAEQPSEELDDEQLGEELDDEQDAAVTTMMEQQEASTVTTGEVHEAASLLSNRASGRYVKLKPQKRQSAFMKPRIQKKPLYRRKSYALDQGSLLANMQPLVVVGHNDH